MKKWVVSKYFIFFLAIFFLLVTILSCENRKSSSSKTVLIFSLRNKANSFLPGQPDSAIRYADSGLALCRKLNLPGDSSIKFINIKVTAFKAMAMFDSAVANLGKIHAIAIGVSDSLMQAKSSLDMGELLLNGENAQLSEKYLIEAKNLYENTLKQTISEKQLPIITYQLGRTYNLYGFWLRNKGDYGLSQELYLKALAIFQKLDKPKAISAICINIGSNYSAIGSLSEAIAYYRLGLQAAKQSNDTVNMIGVYRNIGVFYRTSQPDSSLYYYNLVQHLHKSGNSGQPDVITTFNMANIYADKKDYNTAIQLYDEVLKYCSAIKNPRGILNALSGMASVYSSLGQQNEAIACNKKALLLADSLQELPLVVELMNELQTIYKDQGQFREALLISEKSKHLNDSILSLNKQLAIHELDIKYQSEKKNQENVWLKSELSYQEGISKYRFYFIFVLALATLILLLGLWRRHKLYQSREIAYKVLMSKYSKESELKNNNPEPESVNDRISSEKESLADELLLLNHQLISYYNIEKPYLNPGLKIEDVSAKLNIPQRTIATLLKKNHNSNFNAFTNRYRAEEARQLIEAETHKNFTIEAIALDAGFGSRQSFYNSFELHTGVKPSYYRTYIARNLDKDGFDA